jgi:hypothetical protein
MGFDVTGNAAAPKSTAHAGAVETWRYLWTGPRPMPSPAPQCPRHRQPHLRLFALSATMYIVDMYTYTLKKHSLRFACLLKSNCGVRGHALR